MSSLSLKEQQELTLMFLEGVSPKEIASRFCIPIPTVRKYLKCDDTYIQKFIGSHYRASVARESRRIAEVKDEMISYIQDALTQSKDNPDKMADMKLIDSALATLDRISRLNAETPTEIKEEKNINFDVHKIMQEFKTPEEKKAYLLQQLQNGNGK